MVSPGCPLASQGYAWYFRAKGRGEPVRGKVRQQGQLWRAGPYVQHAASCHNRGDTGGCPVGPGESSRGRLRQGQGWWQVFKACSRFSSQDRATFHRLIVKNNAKKRRMYEAFIESVALLKSLEVPLAQTAVSLCRVAVVWSHLSFSQAVREDEDRGRFSRPLIQRRRAHNHTGFIPTFTAAVLISHEFGSIMTLFISDAVYICRATGPTVSTL